MRTCNHSATAIRDRPPRKFLPIQALDRLDHVLPLFPGLAWMMDDRSRLHVRSWSDCCVTLLPFGTKSHYLRRARISGKFAIAGDTPA